MVVARGDEISTPLRTEVWQRQNGVGWPPGFEQIVRPAFADANPKYLDAKLLQAPGDRKVQLGPALIGNKNRSHNSSSTSPNARRQWRLIGFGEDSKASRTTIRSPRAIDSRYT